MQTFLPYADFKKTARCLDYKRAGKMRVESMQILQVLTGLSKSNAWANHPAVKMWKHYEVALAEYACTMCDDWTSRGYKDSCKEKVMNIIEVHYKDKQLVYPHWLGDNDFHLSHQSNLVRKNKDIYGKIFNVKDDLPYIWPVEAV